MFGCIFSTRMPKWNAFLIASKFDKLPQLILMKVKDDTRLEHTKQITCVKLSNAFQKYSTCWSVSISPTWYMV